MKNLAHKSFKFFLGLFIILIPWQTRWIFSYWNIGAEPWEIGKLSLYGSMIVLLLAAIFFLTQHREELKLSKNKFLYFVFAYSIVIGLWSPLPAVSLYYLLIVYLAVLFAHLCRFLNKRALLYMFLTSGLIQALLALQQSIAQHIWANKWLGLAEHLPNTLGTAVVELGNERILRAYGALPHPNILGGFLFMTIFIGVYLWVDFYQRGEKERWGQSYVRKNVAGFLYVITTLVVATYALLATFSRSAVLALLASLFSVAIINVLRRKWLRVSVVIRYAIIFIIVVLSFNAWFGDAWTTRLQVAGRLEEKSVKERYGSFNQFYTASGKDILFGQGMAMNTKVTKDHNPTEAVYNIQPIHDTFALALAEVGVIGILLIIGILRMVIKEADEIDTASTSLLLGLMVIGLFDHYLWTTWTGWLMMVFGLVNMYKQKK
ncbi:MAG: hypothetical protein C3F02_01410 [Parcubacteria group bacterium]|nr:MAG: hypothetical protein C3F02_01410 [Parcubacteria group bacterium]